VDADVARRMSVHCHKHRIGRGDLVQLMLAQFDQLTDDRRRDLVEAEFSAVGNEHKE
jgi:hypothetical protein